MCILSGEATITVIFVYLLKKVSTLEGKNLISQEKKNIFFLRVYSVLEVIVVKKFYILDVFTEKPYRKPLELNVVYIPIREHRATRCR